ncbi:hypothetical protein KIW84_040652 [Lathyrus oleraceus]|uniref:Uncharacterized protein n=1 Tax=Pisum sativum TaxID=3888 RepID=A0A9D4X7T9_PEA|nr:hypothetical protein KIW84_040652 [Pisum sativum]
MVRSMMSHADLPNSFWGHALLTSAYTLNRVPSKKVEKIPYEIWSETRGYYLYNPSEGKVFVARTGVFLEKDFISKGISGRKIELEEIQESQSIDTPMEELEQETQMVLKGSCLDQKFISELGIVPSIVDPIGLYYDNNGAIAQAKEPRSHQRSKHILRRYHLIREIIDKRDVKICRVPTLDNIADPLIKPLAQQKHDDHTRSMGIRGMPDWL